MPRSLSHLATLEPLTCHAPAVIAAGLAVLIAVAIWPGVPAVTATALVALGATAATLARYRTSPALLAILLLHGTIYAGLVALFVGVTLHQAATEATGLGIWQGIDLVLSVVPIALACRIALVAVTRAADGGGATDR